MSDSVTLEELATATIIPDMGGTESYLIGLNQTSGEFERAEYVDKSARNTLLLKTDAFTEGKLTIGDYTLECDFRADVFRLDGPKTTVVVPERLEENVLWAAYDEDEDRLNSLYDDLTEDRVRVGVMDWFMPRFSSARENDDLRKVKDGWLVRDEILVNWSGENYAINTDETHIVSGDSTVVADETKPARDFNFGNTEGFEAESPAGSVYLEPTEVEFLATVEAILRENGQSSGKDDAIADYAMQTRVSGFTDTKSGIHHGHGLGKHTLGDLNVTDEVGEMLWSNSNDHTAVHEMALRRQEFENVDTDVFTDAPNDSDDKWQKIESTKRKAPIPPSIKQKLRAMYE